MLWRPKRITAISGHTLTTQEFSMVGGYKENLEKPQTVTNGGWALAWDNTVVQVEITSF